jgi:hypothetical protein
MLFKVVYLLLQFTGAEAQAIGKVDDVLFTNKKHHSIDESGLGSILPFANNETSAVRHRQLQVFGGVIDQRCEQLFDNTLENIFAAKDCTCNQVGFPPKLVVDCERVNESCIQRRFTDAPDDKLLCGSPGIRITVNVWSIAFGGSPVVAEVCFYDVSVFNVTVPDIINPVCIGLFAGLPGSVPLANLLGLVFGRTASTAKLLQDSQKSSSSLLKKKQSPVSINKKSCVPIIGTNKEKCNSCTICPPETGGGLIFDCSNIIPNLMSTECTVLPTFI